MFNVFALFHLRVCLRRKGNGLSFEAQFECDL